MKDTVTEGECDREIAKAIERLTAERDAARAGLDKINTIRNSIIGTQSINWSEHIYPLVAALDEAGCIGMPYDEAHPYFGSLFDRAVKAEDERDAAMESYNAMALRVSAMETERNALMVERSKIIAKREEAMVTLAVTRTALAVLRNTIHGSCVTDACSGDAGCWCDDCTSVRAGTDVRELPATRTAKMLRGEVDGAG